ncbi:MAG: threonylcarbamoyl-AMP synthase [Candidatus Magasanikbacteria bacterium]|nr:threonylcarbamoyl-AMP synthase [Candidatus Magasanikbacteria bacterium]MBT4071569.1 threonylcarbamoyl-AMP synthase [Candidatus Magasanikbacteria bacterium]
MQIIKAEQFDIQELVMQLKKGKTIIYPTETCYGLGCDATNNKAVDSVFEIKQRQKNKSVLVLMADIAMAKEYVIWNDTLTQLAQIYWPGPLTIVAPVLADVVLANGVVHESGTIAFRVTSHLVAHDIVTALGVPLVSTSANISSMESPYDISFITDMFTQSDKKPDIIIDAGVLADRAPSTIVSVSDGEVRVLRQGEINVDVV